MSKYNVDYFIKKFNKIPANQWICGEWASENFDGKIMACALGHCGQKDSDKPTNESAALEMLFQKKLGVSVVELNDASDQDLLNDATPKEYTAVGKTPRARIMRGLRDIRKLTHGKS